MSTKPPPTPPPDTEPSEEEAETQREIGRVAREAHDYTRVVVIGGEHKTPRVFPAVRPPEEEEKEPSK